MESDVNCEYLQMCHWSASTESFLFLHCNVAIAPACNGWISLPTQTCNMMLSANMQSDSMCNCTSIAFRECLSKYFPFCLHDVTFNWWATEISNTFFWELASNLVDIFVQLFYIFLGRIHASEWRHFLRTLAKSFPRQLNSTSEAQLSLNLFFGYSAQLSSPF